LQTEEKCDTIFLFEVLKMLGFFLRWAVNLLALVIAGSVIPGIRIQSMVMGIIAAGILGIVNAVIRPLVLILTLPINLVTLGLFTFVINAAMLKLVADLVPGFVVESFRAAFLGALLISFISWMMNIFVNGNGTVVFIKSVKRSDDENSRQ
jgi:putative membrane protein